MTRYANGTLFKSYYAFMLALFALALFTVPAQAQSSLVNPNVQERYRTLSPENAPIESKSDVAVIDSASWATPLDSQATAGCLKVAVSGEFSAEAGTANVTVGFYHSDGAEPAVYTLLWTKTETITANTGGQFSADGTLFTGIAPVTFDTLSATHYDVRVTAKSGTTGGGGATLNLTAWRVGHSPLGDRTP